MSIQQVAFLGKKVCGGEVAVVRLARPDGFDFRAGQWLRLTLQTAEGEETKTFSIASAPADTVLEIATRLTGTPFKRALEGLAPGDTVGVAGPGGRLGLPPDTRRVAFLVGGVGITPARSILRDAALSGTRFDDAIVFYGDRSPECTTFREELQSYESTGVRVVPVYEHVPADEHAETGFITAEIVRRYVDAPQDYAFLVSGPPVMVGAMRVVLEDLGIAEDRRAIESFGSVKVGV